MEAGILYGVYRLLSTRIPRDWAAALAAVGPWLAGWHNLAVILRLAFGV